MQPKFINHITSSPLSNTILLHHNRPQAYFRRYSVATLAEIWAQDTRYIQQANLADPSCLQVDLQCSVYLNSSTIISSPLSNTILPEGHHRPSRDLTTRPPSTRKHPGHTQCLLTSHNHPFMMRVRKLAEEPWTQESCTHPQLSTAQLVQIMEEMVTLSNCVLNGVNYLLVNAIWNRGQIYHRHFSNNQKVTPHHHVHSRMAHGPGDIPENHRGDPIQTQKTTHTCKCLCPDSCHPQPCTTDPQYTKTIHLGK